MKPVIEVENLGKQYRIGALEQYTKGSRELFKDMILAPVRNFRKLRNLTRFSKSDDADVIWALKDVSFTVEQGDIVGVIGSNGAGKSTLLKLLTRITEPSTGKAVLRGRVGSLLEVGTGFHPEMTGRENIYLNGTILGMRKWEIDKKFDEIVAFSEVEKFLDTPVKRYSSGMYVRLAFAVAAHLESEILLVDEVLAVGDIAFQKKCLGKMGDVSKEGRTVLFVSHNMAAVNQLCTKGLLLKNGGLVSSSGIENVISKYREQLKAPVDKSDLSEGYENKAIINCMLKTSLENNIHEWGKPLIIEFDLLLEKPSLLELDVLFINEKHQRICVHLFYDFEKKYSKPGKYHVVCKIPKVRIYKGRYSITILAQDRLLHTMLDKSEYVLEFTLVMETCRLKASPWLDDTLKFVEDSDWEISEQK